MCCTTFQRPLLAVSAALFLLTRIPSADSATLAIQNTVNGSTATLTASSDFGGAITSFFYRGMEYINTDDHGRELQSAVAFNSWGECFNPTEAGNRSGYSSQLQSWSNSNNVLNTSTDMAFWLMPGQSSSVCGSAINTSIWSNIIHQKVVSFGLNGIPNVLNYQITYSVPNQYQYAVFEALTGYMPSFFNAHFTFNPQSSTLTPINDTSTESDYSIPVVFATPDGQHAMAVYSPAIPSAGYYGTYQFSSTAKWNCVFVESGTVVGNYTYNCHVIFGTVEEVTNAIRGLTVGSSNTLVPIFRFHKLSGNGDHFLTASYSEGAGGGFWWGQTYYPTYQFDGTAFRVYASPIDGGMVPLYRCYQGAVYDHFASLYSNCEGQNYEGVYGYISSSPRTGYEAVYRFYRTWPADHLITTDYWEGINNGFAFEQVLGYAPTSNY